MGKEKVAWEAIYGVDQAGCCEILRAAKGMKEDYETILGSSKSGNRIDETRKRGPIY